MKICTSSSPSDAIQQTTMLSQLINHNHYSEQIKMALNKDILDMCFSEDVFTAEQQGMFKKDIPSLNKHKYKTEVIPILETDRISKEEMMNLPCQSTHYMKG